MSRMKYIVVAALGFLASLGCSGSHNENIMLCEYKEFGPQVLAEPLIGSEWYQWHSHGYEDPNYRYNIRVLVYDDRLNVDRVKSNYPTIVGKIDYRYVKKSDAISHLRQEIAYLEAGSEVDYGLVDALKNTLRKLGVTESCR